MQLTSEILRAAYAYLVETPPFNEWNLPDAEDVNFAVTTGRVRQGRCCIWMDPTTIEISDQYHTHTASLMLTMAHEMIHLHQFKNGLKKTKHSWHGHLFQAYKQEVCTIHGFDPGQF